MAKKKKEPRVVDGLTQAIDMIEKSYGKGSIMYMDQDPEPIEVISTGSFCIDEELRVGGVPRGRIIEIIGPESSGKTTLALHIAAEAQKVGGKVAFIDAEHAVDIQYAQNIGVKVDEMLIAQPDSGEQALDIVETLVRSGSMAVVIVDSVAALTPQAEIEGEMGQQHMGLHARLMSQALRKLTALVSKSNTTLIFTNQIRHKIGVMFGSPETTTGGNALKFYASVRIDIRRRDKIVEENKITGNEVEVKIIKNKVGAPFGVAHTRIMYGVGIFRLGEILTYCVDKDIIQKAGSWYQHDGNKMQGESSILAYVEENLDIFEEKIKEKRNEVA